MQTGLTKLRAALLLVGLLGALPAQAALFCAQAAGVMECYFDDANQCRKRAAEIAGACVANGAEILKPVGYQQFCAVYSTRTVECLYLDFSSCDKAAAKANAACMNNTSRRVPVPTRSGVMETLH